MDKKKLILFSSFFVLLITIGSNFVSLPFGLRINQSDSLPHRLFFGLSVGDRQIERGSIISFTHHLCRKNLAKKVTGLPGDRITICADHLYINGKYAGKIQAETSKGIKLFPAKEGLIEPDYFFVMGTHERSFDSRYLEFGLIHRDSIVEILCPLF